MSYLTSVLLYSLNLSILRKNLASGVVFFFPLERAVEDETSGMQ